MNTAKMFRVIVTDLLLIAVLILVSVSYLASLHNCQYDLAMKIAKLVGSIAVVLLIARWLLTAATLTEPTVVKKPTPVRKPKPKSKA